MQTIEPTKPPQRLVCSVEEAARLLGISRAHAYEPVARDELSRVRLGRRLPVASEPVHASTVKALLASERIGGAPEHVWP